MAFNFKGFGMKIPSHKKYGYVPRYYNPEKEEFEERIESLRQKYSKNQNDKEAIKNRISTSLRRKVHNNSTIIGSQTAQSNMVLILVLLALIAGTFIFCAVYLPDLAEKVNNWK